MPRGTAAMSARDAEEFNREFARDSGSGAGFIFVPIAAQTTLHPGRTPKIHLRESGEHVTRTHGAGGSRAGPRADHGGSSRPSLGSMGNASHGPAAMPSSHQRPRRPNKVQAPPASGKQTAQVNKNELKRCLKLLHKLMTKREAYVFREPVNRNKFPQYYEVISNPMDLGTIKTKLENNVYASSAAFAEDVRRVWENCYQFNPPESDYYRYAKKLHDVFEDELQKMQAEQDKEQGPGNDPNLSLMMKEIKRLQQHVSKLESQQTGPEPAGSKRGPGTGKRAGAARSNAAARPTELGPAEPMRDMTNAEKVKLGAQISKCNAKDIGQVMKIIQEIMPSAGREGQEFEVDINKLDTQTLWKLHKFVETSHAMASRKKAKRQSTNATSRKEAFQRAHIAVQQSLSHVEAGLQCIEGGPGDDASYPSSGIQLQSGTQYADSGSPSDSDGSDDGYTFGAVSKDRNAGSCSSHALAGFKNTQREREQRARELQQRQISEADRASQRDADRQNAIRREREAQRAEERAMREQERPVFDMMGQGNAMASFEAQLHSEGTGDFFSLDEFS